MPKLDLVILEISDEEEARIQAGIATDPDNPEWTAEDFASARPASEVLPPALYAALKRRPRTGSKTTEVAVTLHLDAGVVEAYRRTGPGWQGRMNDAVAYGAARLKPARG